MAKSKSSRLVTIPAPVTWNHAVSCGAQLLIIITLFQTCHCVKRKLENWFWSSILEWLKNLVSVAGTDVYFEFFDLLI